MLPDREFQRALSNFASRMHPAQGVQRARTRTLLAPMGDGVTALSPQAPPLVVTVPWDMTVIEWRLVANAPGTLAIDVLHATWLTFPTFTSMTAGNHPTTVAGTQLGNGDTALWSLTLIRETDLLQVQIEEATSAMTSALLHLKCMEVFQ